MAVFQIITDFHVVFIISTAELKFNFATHNFGVYPVWSEHCRKQIEQNVALMQLESETFAVLHNLLLLALMDDEPNLSLLGELHTLAHCRAARLFNSLQLNRTIRELLYKLCDQSTTSKVILLHWINLRSVYFLTCQNQIFLLSEGRDLDFSALHIAGCNMLFTYTAGCNVSLLLFLIVFI